MNIGVDQTIPIELGKKREKVIQIMKSMDTYSKVKVTEPEMDDYRQYWWVTSFFLRYRILFSATSLHYTHLVFFSH